MVGSFSSVLEHLSGVTSHSQLSSVSSPISIARIINLIYNSEVPLFLLLPYHRKLHINRGRKQKSYIKVFLLGLLFLLFLVLPC